MILGERFFVILKHLIEAFKNKRKLLGIAPMLGKSTTDIFLNQLRKYFYSKFKISSFIKRGEISKRKKWLQEINVLHIKHLKILIEV